MLSKPTQWILAAVLVLASCASQEGERPLNVLFIAVDDLRPQLGAYGESLMVTPQLDQLAAEGRLFRHHYVQVPTCGASRFSLLTGTRPSTPDHLNNQAFVRLLPGEEEDMPESFAHLFRRNGYRTVALGKVSHYPDNRVFTYEGDGDGSLEMPFSWNRSWGPTGKWETAWNAFFGYSDGSNRNMERGTYPAYERGAVADTSLPDGLIAEEAVRTLQELKDQPFLLAVGFFKPHLPFTAPGKYWDLYDAEDIDLSPNPEAPQEVHEDALHASNEMFRNYDHPEGIGGIGVRLDDEHARNLRHAYYAAVSYVDAQIGKVLGELERLGLEENTVVVVWGDHGWHLGDHTIWGKHTSFDRSLRSTLIIRTPNMPEPGVPADGLVESLDLYPTLADLAGLMPPPGLGGRSVVPLLNDPGHPGKDAAFGYWRGRRTMRTDNYRLTVYEDEDPRYELFDLSTDPFETNNVADSLPAVVSRLLPIWELENPDFPAFDEDE